MKRFQVACSVALLLFCLLGTHWVGFAHGISHSGLNAQSVEKCSATNSVSGLTHGSDVCHLFDALTLAGFVPVDHSGAHDFPVYTSKIIHGADPLLIESTSASYQSRAPPTFIL